MENASMDEKTNKRISLETEEVDSGYFAYTSETKDTDIPKETLTHLRVDSSVRELPASVFMNCKELTRVQLPVTLKRIRASAFQACSKLNCIEFVSSASLDTPSIKDKFEDGMIVFPERAMLQIDDFAFSDCFKLRKVIFCSLSAILGESAFTRCRSLICVELPEGLQLIEPWLFSNCESLSTVKIPTSVIKIGDSAFYRCPSLNSVDLPHGLLEIGVCAFVLCTSIETLSIPATVYSIGRTAFRHCGGLKHIKLPPILEGIEEFLFYGCERLEYIEIPATVKKIDDMAFRQCSSLSHIRIPPSVDDIRSGAFSGCSRLVSFEHPEGNIFDIDLSGSLSLVNVEGPILTGETTSARDFLQYSKLGSLVDGYFDLAHRLKNRFDSSPLNKLCYYHSYHSSEDAMKLLRSLMGENPSAATAQVDEFGMTPLHILSLSQTPNVDMLLEVMKGGHLDHLIRGRDLFGSTPMDYLCLNRMPNSTEVIRRVLLARYDELLGLDRLWKSDMLQAVDEALAVDWPSRRREIIAISLKLANYERQEIVSILELYLWKLKNDKVGSQKDQIANRQSCRINSGASILIPHVLTFLDKLEVEDSVHHRL
eukprot:scaffold146_cov107-Cylindrotheca_fusiformis.AAC.4